MSLLMPMWYIFQFRCSEEAVAEVSIPPAVQSGAEEEAARAAPLYPGPPGADGAEAPGVCAHIQLPV